MAVPVQRRTSAPAPTAPRRGPRLFEPPAIRGAALHNRIMASPMCQYSSVDGFPTDWHLVHLGSHAVGGAGLVMMEATAVEARGQISARDAGIWDDRQGEAYAPIARFIREHGAVPAIQLAHAGRKASVRRPWDGGAPLSAEEGAWETVAPSAVPFDAGWHIPRALTVDEIRAVVEGFRVVFMARNLLCDPYWPLHAAKELGAEIDDWPAQYLRARR